VRSAQARTQAARVRRDSARAVLDLQGTASRNGVNRLELPAPVDGQVIRRFVESEGFVRAGQPLLEVGDPQALEVIVEALTADATRVAPGTRVNLLRWGGDAPLHGRVQTVEPGGFTKISALGVEEQRVLIVIALEEAQEDRPALGDGYRVEAEFRVWSADSVLTVPVAALFRDGTQWAVYTIDDGRARMRHVRIGQIGERAAEVRAGLREGSMVVLYPGDSLRDGARVEYRRQP
jgi:HlyD family secretion protein